MGADEEKENLLTDLAVFLISKEEADPGEFRKYGLNDSVLKFIFASSGLTLQRPPSKPVTRVARRLLRREKINDN